MKILFFTPFGERNGAELLLWRILAHADRKRYEMAIACRLNGELFSELPPGVKWFKDLSFPPARLYRKVRREIFPSRRDVVLTRLHRKFKADVWYLNTLLMTDVLRFAMENRIPCIVHSHELEPPLAAFSEREINDIIAYPQLVIACSAAAADVLRVAGRKSNIEVCHGMIDVDKVRSVIDSRGVRRAEVRRALGFDESCFVWAMAGGRYVNKDLVMFVDAAREVLINNPNAGFVWLGGEDNGYSFYVKKYAEACGISHRVRWVEALPDADYYEHLYAADGFVLTSHRDSFPIVMLEAAALGLPIVSFDSGGVRELVMDGMGEVITMKDARSLAQTMNAVMGGETKIDKNIIVNRAREFDVEPQIARWEKAMQSRFG